MDSLKQLRSLWTLDDGVTYLNHGSFGPSPRPVLEAYAGWSQRLERNPMTFLLRQFESAIDDALNVLAGFIGTSCGNLVFVDNATFAMNIVAASVDLQAGDEVLLNQHEYGAVVRIWRRRCQQVGARVVIADLSLANDAAGPGGCDQPGDSGFTRSAPASATDVATRLMEFASDRTRLIVLSHVTSPTAVTLPVTEVCRLADARGIPVCIDGPHALGLVDVNLRHTGCDFYCASCHKWLSAPFGSGFLFVHPRQQKRVKPVIVSWGGSVGGRQPSWKDEFQWLGTRNPAAFLAVADAVKFMTAPAASHGIDSPDTVLDLFRTMSRDLTNRAARGVEVLSGRAGLTPLEFGRVPGMVCVPIRPSEDVVQPGQRDPLQDRLSREYGIEVPVIHWQGRRMLRVSAHLYNTEQHIDCLLDALHAELAACP